MIICCLCQKKSAQGKLLLMDQEGLIHSYRLRNDNTGEMEIVEKICKDCNKEFDGLYVEAAHQHFMFIFEETPHG